MPAGSLLIPVLHGTVRRGARSAAVARQVSARLDLQPDLDTRFINISALGLTTDDEGTDIKQPEFSALIEESDALVIVSPEYNHGYPGSLKHALDTNYHEYVHKPVGLVGVSTGVLGGARMIENLLPVLRAVGLVPIQRDVLVGNVDKIVAPDGTIDDERLRKHIDGMLTELRWMALALRHGRESISSRPDRPAITCSRCSSPMNRHGLTVDAADGDKLEHVHTCPRCGGSVVETVE